MAKSRRTNQVKLLGVVRRKRAALMVSTALQATVMLVLSQPADAQPAPNARPTGGNVIAGGAAISQTATNTQINQSTQRAAIDWKTFNVGSQQSVTFKQPNATSVTLNRVTGPDPSQIAGRIDANGQVILTNQSGVTFFKGAQVNTNGLMVSAIGASKESVAAFMAGSAKLALDQPGNPNAVVDNRGNITVKEAGLAALVAPRVANSGTITAQLGHVVLAGAKTATLDLYGDGLLALDVTNQVTQAPVDKSGNTVTALVTNTGVVIADGGTVQLTARAADGIVQNLVEAGGKIRAATMGDHTGTVALNGVGGSIVVEGQLSAPGRAPGTKGGDIEVATTGNVVVKPTARINASGKAGGGTVAIGTDLARVKGGPSATPTVIAANTAIQAGAKIRANATSKGDGGNVTVLSGATTIFGGTILAQGGPNGGAGGMVETSGVGHLFVTSTAAVSAAAAHGKPGNWLLDPDSNIDITAPSTNPAANPSAGVFQPFQTAAGDSSTLDPAVIQAALTAGTSVLVTTSNSAGTETGNIRVGVTPGGTDGAIDTFTAPAAVLLTLTAGGGGGAGSITINSPISDAASVAALPAGKLSVVLNAGANIAFNNTVGIAGSLNATAAIIAPASAITVNAGGAISAIAGIGLFAGTGGISLADNVTATGNTVTLASTGAIKQTAGVITAGTLTGISVGGTSLTQNNLVTSLGAFNDSGAASTGFLFTDATALGTTGIVSSTGPITLTTKGAGSNLTLGAGVTAGVNTVTLASAGTIKQTAGVITAGILTGSSVGGTSLTQPGNLIGTLAAFSTTAGNFAIEDSAALTIASTVNAGGNAYLESSNAAGISFGATGAVLSAAGGTIGLQTNALANLGTAGATGVANTGATGTFELSPDTANAVTLGNPTGLSLTNLTGITAGTLRIGAVTQPGGALPTILANAISVTGAFNLGGADLDLRANGPVTQTAVLTNVGTLTGSSVGGTTLTQNNLVTSLGAFADTGAGSTGFLFTDATTLGTTGTVSSASGPVTLTTTGAGSNLTLGAAVTASGNTVTLTSAGTIKQTAGVITAGTLTGSSVGGANLTQNNLVTSLGAFADTGLASTGFLFTDATALGTTGIVSSTGPITLTTKGAGSNLTLGAAVSASGNTVTLTSAGTINQTAGVITAGTLTGSSVGGTNLTRPGNLIGTLAAFSTTAGNFAIEDSAALTIASTVNAGGNAYLESSNAAGISFGATGAVLSAAGGTIGLQTNALANLGTAGATGVANTGATGTFELSPDTANAVTLGNPTGLSLTNLTGITAGTLRIGAVTQPGGALPTILANAISVTGAFNLGGANLDLRANGPVTQTAVLTNVGTLTGSSVGGTTLTQNNLVTSLGAFTDTGAASTGFLFTDAATLGTTGTVSSASGPVTLTTTGAGSNLTLGAAVTASGNTVTLASAGTINQTAGVITAGTLTGSSVGGANLTQNNLVTSLGAFADTGLASTGFLFTDATALGTTGIVSSTGPITLTTKGAGSNLTLGAAVSASGNTVTLTSAGTIKQTAGVITAGTLTGISVGGTNLTQNNLVTSLGAFADTGAASTGFLFTDATALGTTGTVSSAAGPISLTTKGAGSDLTLGAAVTASGNTVTLTSAGRISQTAGVITAGILTGSSVGGTSLTQNNLVTSLGAFADTGAASTGFLLTDATKLGTTGTVSSASGPVTLTTTGAGSDLTLGAAVTAAGNTVTLTSAGTINQTAGVITAGTLTGSSVGGTSLTQNNLVTSLGAFADTGAASTGFLLTDATALGTTGTVSSATGPITLTTTGAGSDLTLGAAVTASGNTVTLASAGRISQTAGVITAGILTGSSVGGTSLTQNNLVTSLGTFADTGAASTGFLLTDATKLGTTGTVSSASGPVTLTTTGAGSDLTLGAAVTASGNTVTLTSAGRISQTAGVITAGTLTGSSVGGTSLTQNNLVTSLGAFADTGAASTGFLFTDATALGTTGTVSSASGPVTLTTKGAGSNLTLGGAVTASGNTVTLASAGTINQTAGVITAGTLTGSSVGGTSLTQNNLVTSLGAFADTGLASTGFLFTDATILNTTGTVSSATGPISLTTTGAGSNLALGAAVTASGNTVTLTSAGTINQTAGVITAGTLTGSSVGGATLTQNNLVTSLRAFADTGAGSTGFLFTDATTLGTTGTVSSASGPVTLTTTGAGSNLTLGAAVTASGNTVTLASAGTINQTAGVITAGTLTGSSVGGTSLTQNNLVTSLGALADTGAASTGFLFTDATTLNTTGTVSSATGPISLTTTGAGSNLTLGAAVTAAGNTVTLTSAGTINQTAGAITAGTLTGSSVGGASLTQNNLVTSLGAFADTGAASTGFLFTDATKLGTTGTVSSASGPVTLTTTGAGSNLTLGTAVTASGNTVTLTSAGTINQTAGVITAGTLTGSSVGGASLTQNNLVTSLGAFADTGAASTGFLFTDATALGTTGTLSSATGPITLTTTGAGSDLTLGAAVTAAGNTVTLTSAGTINQTAGVITAGTLTGSSVGGANLTQNNLVTSLGAFADTGAASTGFLFTDATALGTTGTVSSATGPIMLTTTGPGSNLTLGAAVTASGNTVTLTSAGTISQTAGVITAGILTGSSVGGATLTQPGNLIDNLGNFSATGFALNDGVNLTVSGSLAGGPNATVLDKGTLTVASTGTVSAIAISLTAGNIAIPGLVTDGGSGTTSLIANLGTINETGTLIAGTLSGSAVAAASFTGATPTTNQVATLSSFAASSFTFDDGLNLTITGKLNGGPSVTVLDNSTLAIAPGATVTANAVSLRANSIGIAGDVTDGGSGTVSLIANLGTINETGTLIAGTLSGSSVGATSLTGATPTTNQVAKLGNFTASGFTLNDGHALAVTGTLNGGPSAAILDAGGLTIGGTVTAAAIGLTAGVIDIPGVVTDGGSGSVSLIANKGSIGETGTLIAGSLAGSAVANANLAGSTPTSNQVATLGSFKAAGFTLRDGKALAVSGTLAGGPSASITDASALTIGGTVTAAAIGLTASSISIPGAVSDGGTGTTSLTATAGSINETGTIVSGTLSGSSTGTASLAGASPTANRIASLGNFAASGLTLVDGSDLAITGSVAGGPTANVTVNGSLKISGSLNAGTIDITTNGGSITAPGTVTTGLLNANATGDAGFTGTANRVDTLGSITSGGTLTLNDAVDLQILGILTAPKIAIDTGANALTFANNATIVTSGTARPPGTVTIYPTAANSPTGAFLASGSFMQVGNSFVVGIGGGPNILRIDTTGSGNITFDPIGGLHALNTWLILGVDAGNATGNVFVQNLDVVRTGAAGSTTLTGSVNNLSGPAAAGAANIEPSPSSNFRFNSCPIHSVNCVLLPVQGIPTANPLNDISFGSVFNPDDQDDLLLPIVSDQDY